jgi:hypothetical protein
MLTQVLTAAATWACTLLSSDASGRQLEQKHPKVASDAAAGAGMLTQGLTAAATWACTLLSSDASGRQLEQKHPKVASDAAATGKDVGWDGGQGGAYQQGIEVGTETRAICDTLFVIIK